MRALPLLLTLAALATPAAAQDGSEATAARTPENARKFLSKLPSNFTVSITDFGLRRSLIITKISTIRHESDCTTALDGLPMSYVVHLENGQMLDSFVKNGDPALFDQIASQLLASGMKPGPYRLDWTKVAEIKADSQLPDGTPLNSTLTIILPDSDYLHLGLPSKEMAGRVFVALETLRVACDPISDTGF